ncbi:DUF2971 domain-containing protein [Bacillus paranthracis]|uniref:DUF2971 domain-containing protein n=1 Tax=Bacillus paranthracis TaxID=2026186 RepID=UPI003980FE66
MYNFDKLVYTDDFMWETLGIRELPSKLYHYTSIDTLIKIIENKSIRFNRLDKVNDPEEALSSSIENANTSVFVSCWNVEDGESLYMWNMYGDNFKGVRIEIPSNMFKGRHSATIYEKGGSHTNYDGKISIERENLGLTLNSYYIIGPNKVAYVNNRELLISKTIHNQGDNIHVNLYDLGLFKNDYWKVENEWRFKIIAMPQEANYPNDKFTDTIIDFEKYPVKQTEIFLDLDESALKEMKLIVGSKCDDTEFKRIEQAIKNLGISVEKSKIKIR